MDTKAWARNTLSDHVTIEWCAGGHLWIVADDAAYKCEPSANTIADLASFAVTQLFELAESELPYNAVTDALYAISNLKAKATAKAGMK